MSILRTSVALTLLALLSRILGLGRDLTVAWVFGANAETDAFYIASSIANAAYVVIAASLTSVTIPLLTRRADPDVKADNYFYGGLVNLVFLVLAGLAALGVSNADRIARILASEASEAMIAQTADYIAVLMPTIALLGTAGMFSGLLNYNRVFLPVAFAPVLLNLSVVLNVVLFGRQFGLEAAVFGTFLGAVLFLAVQTPVFYRTGYRHIWRLALRGSATREFLASAWPVIAVALVSYAYAFVDISVGVRIGEGTVTGVNIASKLIQLPQGILAMGLTTAAYPLVARLVEAGNQGAAAVLTRKLAVIIVLFSTVAAVLILVQSDLIVSVVFGHGTFPPQAAAMTSDILAVLALALPALALNVTLLRVLYAARDWMTPLVAVLIAFVVKVVSAYALLGRFGIDAIALSTVVSVNFNAVLLMLFINHRVARPFNANFWASAAKVMAASVVIGALLSGLRYMTGEWLSEIPDIVVFFGISLTGTALFAVAALGLLRKEVGYLSNLGR
ncbi:MAG: murein biosynthesis integral membrane protein MurJ [Flavobacteriaceae bacterium]|uniref:murein biosynthesis integral membrane protein MurJ n=1 Tax=Marivivens aquimaris TaxID=2774876 RepID=UPI0017D62F00|nr:murein biosynthesis integral membrane protein MurJ [Marivivens aquimaris]NVJ64180.1 murein biosynthesis integral membrane protein MurJ [Flavobacteriaceae bacterium]